MSVYAWKTYLPPSDALFGASQQKSRTLYVGPAVAEESTRARRVPAPSPLNVPGNRPACVAPVGNLVGPPPVLRFPPPVASRAFRPFYPTQSPGPPPDGVRFAISLLHLACSLPPHPAGVRCATSLFHLACSPLVPLIPARFAFLHCPYCCPPFRQRLETARCRTRRGTRPRFVSAPTLLPANYELVVLVAPSPIRSGGLVYPSQLVHPLPHHYY